MKKLRIGILGTSDIAFRRFLPALSKTDHFEYVGVASRDINKTKKFVEVYGGIGYESYEALLQDESIDAIYLPLPPSLHYMWAERALKYGKHILVEKPFTTNAKDTVELIKLAKEKELAVFENYMFVYHSQLNNVVDMVRNGKIGEIRQIRIAFGFPQRDNSDFRYNKQLGGGSLLDCGGYTIKLATLLLGDTARVVCSKLNYSSKFEVDLFGTATLQNDEGIVAQVGFGMDNAYKCELEVWGSKANIRATRIFTAGDGFEPELIMSTSSSSKTIKMPSDDHFLNSINDFKKCIQDRDYRLKMYNNIQVQANIVEKIIINN